MGAEPEINLEWITVSDRAAYFAWVYMQKKPLPTSHSFEDVSKPPSTNNFTVPDLTIKAYHKDASLNVMSNNLDLSTLGKSKEADSVIKEEEEYESLNKASKEYSVPHDLTNIPIDLPTCSKVANGFSLIPNDIHFVSVKEVVRLVRYKFSSSLASHVQKKQYADQMENKWREVYNSTPRLFKQIDFNDETQCLWVWEYMSSKYIAVPFKPASNTQRRLFIFATFDNWDGWTEDQLQQLRKARKDKVSKAFLSLNSMPLSSIDSHKNLFLQEIEKAWRQKNFRKKEKTAKEVIDLSVSYMKKLAEIGSHFATDTANGTLKKLIDEYYSNLIKKNDSE